MRGKLISETYGEQDGHCQSLSGQSSAEEAVCKQSYDIDAAGFHWQCVVALKSSGGFTCQYSHLCQHEENPAAVWDSLPVLSADVKLEMTLVDFEKTANRHPHMARLTGNKFLVFARNNIGGKGMQCQAVEDVVGGILTGDRLDIPSGTQHGAQISENKVAICRHAGSMLRCYTVTANARSLSKTSEQDMPNRISPMEYTYMPTLLYLEEHKVLLCG
ncbi:unnamed protein product [Symbiodinium sp. CCMP2456]|nr:unnamed protein product [Symbiodinium sp. CCMP2456]